MKPLCLLFLLAISCQLRHKKITEVSPEGNTASPHTTQRAKVENEKSEKLYTNERFRKVTATKTGSGTFQVKGEAQVFEASFGWDVGDGHEVLASGHQMTNAGAPAWGQFDFTFEVKKERENSTLTLVLFDVSAKDGSRQHELAVGLE